MSETNLHIATPVYEYQLNKDPFTTGVRYLQNRKGIIKKHIEALDIELKAIQVLLDVLESKICPTCNGKGQLLFILDQSDSEMRTCKACSGTGRPQDD